METGPIQFMVEFTMPSELPEAFINTIQQQRDAVNKLLNEGKILTYALSLENSRLWAVFSVVSEAELMELVYDLPLTHFMKVKVHELTFYNTAHPFTPAFSMN
jgi:muconolactone delta-isomerase